MLYILTLFFLIVQSTEAKYGWAWNPPVMVRDEPYLSGDFVAWLEDDSTRVKILSVCGMDSSWYYIELPNGKRGYVPRKRIITAPKEEYFRQLKQELYSLAQPIDPETILVVNPIKIYQQIDYKQLQCDTGISIPLHSQVVLVGIYGKYYLAKWGNFQGFVNKFGTNSIANQSLYVQSLSKDRIKVLCEQDGESLSLAQFLNPFHSLVKRRSRLPLEHFYHILTVVVYS